MSRVRLDVLRRKEPLRIGFLPVSDCAPLVFAAESGLFEKYDLEVQLQREFSWAGLRDKVILGELDAAQAPATLPFLANLGLESDPCACVSGMVLSLQGNAIAISRRLWDEGVQSAESLRERIYKDWGKRTYTFGVVFSYSTQELLLRQWLKAAGIDPNTALRIVAIPSTQMFPTLKLGYIDGYCAAEPWTSVAVHAGVGVCVATSAEVAPKHPEKLLMVRQSFAAGRADEHQRLLAALLEACAFCDLPYNRPYLSEILASPQYVNAPIDCVRAGLMGPFRLRDRQAQDARHLPVFHYDHANDPTDEKARWIMTGLYELLEETLFKNKALGHAPVLKNIFRRDIFENGKIASLDASAQLVGIPQHA
ncbi:MAG TPA: CmpA/NrtA family ABC transporter substrate-binding protein [Candidatus Limnocylindrales bacterium]|nr:CmpA/NrtA family ABC transporter substrate-binding protein [Candidatus Limnocylindrales bacterium]